SHIKATPPSRGSRHAGEQEIGFTNRFFDFILPVQTVVNIEPVHPRVETFIKQSLINGLDDGSVFLSKADEDSALSSYRAKLFKRIAGGPTNLSVFIL